jgi:hypothetical protein
MTDVSCANKLFGTGRVLARVAKLSELAVAGTVVRAR